MFFLWQDNTGSGLPKAEKGEPQNVASVFLLRVQHVLAKHNGPFDSLEEWNNWHIVAFQRALEE